MMGHCLPLSPRASAAPRLLSATLRRALSGTSSFPSPLPPLPTPSALLNDNGNKPRRIKSYSIATTFSGSSPSDPPSTTHLLTGTGIPLTTTGSHSKLHPQPIDLVLGGLAGCLRSTCDYVFSKWSLPLTSSSATHPAVSPPPPFRPPSSSLLSDYVSCVSIQVEGHRDSLGAVSLPLSVTPPLSSRLFRVHGQVVVHAYSDLPLSSVSSQEDLARDLEKCVEVRCPVSNMLRASGCDVDLKWSIDASHKRPGDKKEGVVKPSSSSSSSSSSSASSNVLDGSGGLRPPPRSILIVGGGLAGLGTTYNLLRHSTSPLCITILDPLPTPSSVRPTPSLRPQTSASASQVAAGILHPFTANFRSLIHAGEAAMEASLHLLSVAASFRRESQGPPASCALRRAALSSKESQGHHLWGPTSLQYGSPFPPDDGGGSTQLLPFGGATLKGGCQVVDVPSYLEGLYGACRALASSKGSTLTWRTGEYDLDLDQAVLAPLPAGAVATAAEEVFYGRSSFDATVFCGGARLFAQPDVVVSSSSDAVRPEGSLRSLFSSMPVTLVGGQALCLTFRPGVLEDMLPQLTSGGGGLLCGKYVLPIAMDGDGVRNVVVGATHEYGTYSLERGMLNMMTVEGVVADLKARTEAFLPPSFWTEGSVSNCVRGVRAQTRRGGLAGRIPIVGRIGQKDFVFTGLGSRGFILHGLYSDYLSKLILGSYNDTLPRNIWWNGGAKV